MPLDDVLPVTETPQNKLIANDCCMIKIQIISQITWCPQKIKCSLTLQKKLQVK
jgi:hypothetical protein